MRLCSLMPYPAPLNFADDKTTTEEALPIARFGEYTPCKEHKIAHYIKKTKEGMNDPVCAQRPECFRLVVLAR
jgi:hypothetical protein